MKQLSVILLASLLVFASCSKEEDQGTPTTGTTNETKFKGSYILKLDNNNISELGADVLYIRPYNRIEVKGKGKDGKEVILFINDIPSENNKPFSCKEGSILLTYGGIPYNTGDTNSGTITRKSTTKVIFEDIVVKQVIGAETKTFSGEANIGRTVEDL